MRVVEGDANRPFAYADPRSLSQAWYDALYANREHGEPKASQETRAARDCEARAERPPAEIGSREETGAFRHAPHSTLPATRIRSAGVPPADRVAAARERERSARTAAPPPRDAVPAVRATLVVRSEQGAEVTVLLEQRGTRVGVVAIGDAAAAERIAEALASARAALAAKGIRLEHAVRNRGEA